MFSKKSRVLSLTLTIVMMLAYFTVFAIPVSAADDDTAVEDFTTIAYANMDEKLATMEMVYAKGDYELWYHAVTGETAVRNIKTGQVLASNPYDVGAQGSSTAIKNELLSQLVIKYTDNDKEDFFDSYQEAALNKQIKMKKIKGGIRVEYTIGKEEKRKLVPRMIEATSFEENIMQYITTEREIKKMEAYYTLKDANDPNLTERAKKELQISYPITKFMAIYIFDPSASERELSEIEGYIQKNTKYTFEMMDEDHQKVEHVPKDKAPPLFKMALEYYLDEDGFYVRLPANGIRFDESTYKLSYINVLPYMGAGRRGNTGYTFIPDGSGALVNFEDVGDTTFTLTNKLYGHDYSFWKISGNHTEKWRLPIFGIVENFTITREIEKEEEVEVEIPAVLGEDGEIVEAARTETEIQIAKETTTEDRSDGFIAVIEDGDAMAEITTDHAGTQHIYNSAYTRFTPRPVDQFNLSFETSGLNSLMSVASRRKYAGNYIIRYIMLSGEKATYSGMAEAYRNYLVDRGDLVPLEDTGEDIPLYIETFGTTLVEERFFGFPAFVKKPLTTFEDTKEMIDILNSNRITNINFKLTGWANNGLNTTIPNRVKIESKLGGKNGFSDLLSYASSKGATIYPDLNFSLVSYSQPFDGFSFKRDSARCMDDTASVAQEYFFLSQTFRFNGGDVISSNVVKDLYNKAMKDYLSLNVGSISVASLGKELHSDQDKRKLINRQESKQIYVELLETISDDHDKLLIDAGNLFAVKYADAILNVSLDSSNFVKASSSIPFFGMVTHGYVDIAGTPINMAGDYGYELLKAIENGANPYFILSFQNTSRLKESFDFNKYYSVNFQTWLEDLVSTYHTLNDALKPVRAKPIVKHEFLDKAYKLVKVTYEGGTSFILNYNNNEVEVEGYTLGPLEFVKVK